MGWQAKLAHYSCVSRLGTIPIVVVHALNGRLRRAFADIARVGGRVVPVPSYCLTHRGHSHLGRNAAGTLLEAARLVGGNDRIVLCDPDLVFVRRPRFGWTLSGAEADYLAYEDPLVLAAARRLGIGADAIAARGDSLRCGTPFVVPASLAAPLAQAWMAALEAFWPLRWLDQMYAFGLATVLLGVRVRRSRFTVDNRHPHARLQVEVVHYCQDSALWSKRRFFRHRDAARVWAPPRGRAGTVLGEVLRQLEEAGRYFATHARRRRNPLGEERMPALA
jgi:hypothetical protein